MKEEKSNTALRSILSVGVLSLSVLYSLGVLYFTTWYSSSITGDSISLGVLYSLGILYIARDSLSLVSIPVRRTGVLYTHCQHHLKGNHHCRWTRSKIL